MEEILQMNEQEKQWREEFDKHENKFGYHLSDSRILYSVWRIAKQSSQSIIDQQAKEIEELKARNAELERRVVWNYT